jgi:hypothetical protein
MSGSDYRNRPWVVDNEGGTESRGRAEGNTLPTNIEARVTQHDREIAAIRKLILTGMKLLNQTQVEVKKVAVAQ